MQPRIRARRGPSTASASSPAHSANQPRSADVEAPRLADRLRYAFDNSMTRGTPALVGWLVVATVVLVVCFAVITALLGLRQGRIGFGHEVFAALMHALDPGTVAGDTGGWPFLLVMLALTIGGLFIVSALIGVLSAGIDTRLAELRRGRSQVLERDHTVILGWSDSVVTILRELSIANESRRRPVVVLMADRDKVEMEEELRAKVPDLRGTRLVCRSGSPMDVDDLAVTSHRTARSVILLAPDTEDPDAEVIKTLLALTHGGEDGPRIVAEIRDPANLEAARLVARDRASLLDIRDTVARLLVQTSRQSGAAAVYTELFDYDGDEIYFLADHGLEGATYGEAQLFFEKVTVIGLRSADGSVLNPPPDLLVGGHELVVVAEDDSVLAGAGRALARPDPTVLGELGGVEVHPTRALLLGWNQRAPLVLEQLDRYALPGSTLTVVSSVGAPGVPALANIAVEVVPGTTTDRRVLEQHLVAGLDQVLVLCYSDHLEVQAADARTLVTLLHVRDLLSGLDQETAVVSEMLDDRNRVLAQVADIDDVVVSGEIVSLIVTQLSEDPRLEEVFVELLGPEGSEIYLRPAEWYVAPGAEVSWATVVAAATHRGETALGYKARALATPGADFGVRVNPAKSEQLRLVHGDRVVVLAAD